jgi:hypothetical protein
MPDLPPEVLALLSQGTTESASNRLSNIDRVWLDITIDQSASQTLVTSGM